MNDEYVSWEIGSPTDSAEGVRDTLQTNEKGIPRQTIMNCRKVLLMDPLLQDKIRYNSLTGMIDLVGTMPWRRPDTPALTDTDLHEIECRLESLYDLRSDKAIQKAINVTANDNQYNPILEYLESLVWDGETRIRTLMPHFLGTEDSEFTLQVTLLLMRAALRRLYEPGCKYDSIVCLVGEQGTGKSTYFRFLALKDEWFSDDLKRLDDENIYRKLQGHWIIELSEMIATANARSIEDIKGFLSRQKDTYKVPYDRYPKDYLRQCIFVGTTNSTQFLPFDRSGNRRFIPIRVNSEKAQVDLLADEAASRHYFEQAWAEMMQVYRCESDHSLILPKSMQDHLKALQREYMPEDDKAGILLDWLENRAPDYVCSRMIYEEAFGKIGEPKPWELGEICDMMNRLTDWERFNSHRFPKYGGQRGWKRPKSSDACPIDDPEELPLN